MKVKSSDFQVLQSSQLHNEVTYSSPSSAIIRKTGVLKLKLNDE